MRKEKEWLEAIEELVDFCHNIAKDKGWWDEPRNDGEIIALMHSELSECLEAMRDNDGIVRIGEELADCCIRIFDYCGSRQINLGWLILRKIAFNMTREYKHGGKEF